MMSIGLIEQLSLVHDDSTVITYFFCRNADVMLNDIAAIVKGLIFRLVSQRVELKECLRRRWDTEKQRFNEDMTPWRTLWHIFLEMLEQCKCKRLYIVVDALDECQDEGMAEFLKLMVRTGLGHPSKVKWLLTSRPLDSFKHALSVGSDQELISLELNSKHIAEAVRFYIAARATELDRLNNYGSALRGQVEEQLIGKAEDTFLWVSLVCQRLESVPRKYALSTIQELPQGLSKFYHRILTQLSGGEPDAVKECMRLLKVMLVVYRPLRVVEVNSVMDLSTEESVIDALVRRCAPLVRRREMVVEFVHKSAQDYLVGKDGQSLLEAFGDYGHSEITLSCLSCMSGRLKVNLLDLPQPASTPEWVKTLKDERRGALLASLDYAATFWMQHLADAKQSALIRKAITEPGKVSVFLRDSLLEWLECLSWLGQLHRALGTFKILQDAAEVSHGRI